MEERSKSLYAQYMEERNPNRVIIEDDESMLDYEIVDGALHIHNFFVVKQSRRSYKMPNLVAKFHQIAKDNGAKLITATADPRSANSDIAFRAILAIGMKPFKVLGDLVLFTKEVSHG